MKKIVVLFFLISGPLLAQNVLINVIELPVAASLRGLSVVDDKIFWVGGTMGTICKSATAGKLFVCMKVPGNEDADFRSVYAFDFRKAIIANVGTPAKIFLTEDGGTSWLEVYVNNHKDAFIDGIDFWNEKEGLAFGDPIDGKLLLVNTADGGATWNELPRESQPDLEEGEASFAASGTTIRCFENGRVIIATGGKVSRLLLSNDFGKSWSTIYTPILQGEATTGIFSFDFINKNEGIIVGGDYQIDSLKMDHVFYTSNGGTSWQRPVAPTNGYREGVLFVNDTIVLAAGPNGIDISYDAGNYWESLSDLKGFHTVKKAKKGDTIVLSGAAGKIATISAKALTEKQ